MNVRAAIERGLTYSPLVAGAIYGAVVIALLGMVWIALADLYTGQSELANAATTLERLHGRKVPVGLQDSAARGSPFLDGPSVTIAGAALLQRVAGAITKVGGTIQSSQVDVARGAGGGVKLLISCEITQPEMQRLLYDLEAGMPFLFVDELTAEMPQAIGAVGAVGANGRMHVQLAVSGQWQGAAR